MRQFYSVLQEEDKKLFADIDEEHWYDFSFEKIYKVPLEYPHNFKMEHGDFKDYTPTILSPVFSKKFRDLINEFVPQESIEWVHFYVENKDGSLHDAYTPRFVPTPHMFDVLNEEHSVITEHGLIMFPVFSKEKTKDKHFIRLAETAGSSYVSEDLKKAMQKAKITGVSFEKERMYP